MNKDKSFLITRVVTKDFITDSFQTIRNMFGLRLRRYEDVINQNYNEMIDEMNLKYKNIKWYRSSFNPLTGGSIMINLYGELR